MALEAEQAELLNALLARHPWYTRQSEVWRWPLLRAAQEGWADPETRSLYLPPTQAEIVNAPSTVASATDPLAQQVQGKLSARYAARLQQTPGLSALSTISDRFGATLFQQPPVIDYQDDELEEWAENVDGSGTTLVDLMTDVEMEAIVMGRAGIWIDRPQTPEGAVVTSRADQRRLGTLSPRARMIFTEEITDWHFGEDGILEWVKLEFQTSRKVGALDPLELVIRWVVLDRTSIRRWEGVLRQDDFGAREPTDPTSSPLTGFPGPTDIENRIESLVELETVEHGLNRVPFAFAVAKRSSASDPGQASSILAGTSRADLAALQEDSHGTFSRALHASPLLAVWTREKIAEVFRNAGHALHFKPGGQGEDGEDVRYITTDAQAMDVQMRAVEGRRLEAYREAGAEPTGFFSESSGATPESGRAKAIRYGTGEGRILAQLAKRAEVTHTEALEIGARWLASGEPAPTAEMVFQGSVEYPQTFDLVPEDELIDQYTTLKGQIPSPTWEEGMQTRIALATIGEVAPDTRKEIQDEIEEHWQKKREMAEQMPEEMLIQQAMPGPGAPPAEPGDQPPPQDQEAALQGAQQDAQARVAEGLAR